MKLPLLTFQEQLEQLALLDQGVSKVIWDEQDLLVYLE